MQTKEDFEKFTDEYFESNKGPYEIDNLIGYSMALVKTFRKSGQIESPAACVEFVGFYQASIDCVCDRVVDTTTYLTVLVYLKVLPIGIKILEEIAAKHKDCCAPDLFDYIKMLKASMKECRVREKKLLSYGFKSRKVNKKGANNESKQV